MGSRGDGDLGEDSIITMTENPETIFSLVEMLGSGSYGKVFKAQNLQNNKYYAVKIVSTINGDLDNLKKEISILKDCQSDYIVRYYGSYLYNEQLWLIMEYCDIGSVNDLMKATQRTLNELHIACILKGVLQGLKYLHNTKKIHRDVKAGNILINKDGVCKLADFGVSAELINTMGYIESFIGTPFWMSPEILSNTKYNKKTDIWSLGITAIEMAEGNPPYSNHKPVIAMMQIIKKPPQGLSEPFKWSLEFNRFVSRCLTIDPDLRPNCEELLLDPFIINNTATRVNPQQCLMGLVSENMESIRIFRKNLLENQKIDVQEEKRKQQQQQQQQMKKKSDQEKQKDGGRQDDKKNADKRLMTEASQDFQDFVVNESGTLIEYQNYEGFADEQHQQFYKKQTSSNLIWENETGTMVEKIDEDDEDQQYEVKKNNNDFMKQFSKIENTQQNSNWHQPQKEDVYNNKIYGAKQDGVQNDDEDEEIDQCNNSVIIKEDHEIEHIKGQAYSGVVLNDSEKKPQQKVPDFVLFARKMEDIANKKMAIKAQNLNIQTENIKLQFPAQSSQQEDNQIPSEYKNMSEQMIESKMEQLKRDLENEMKAIQESYAQKISRCEKALSIVKSKRYINTPTASSVPIQQIQLPQIQSNNFIYQEPVSPIKRPVAQNISSQYLISPQSTALQNQDYQQQCQSPHSVPSLMPQITSSPYTKNLLNASNQQYDSNSNHNNNNIMNSSMNNVQQLAQKIQPKIFNNMNNLSQVSSNNLANKNNNNNNNNNNVLNMLNPIVNSIYSDNLLNPVVSNIYSEMPLPATPKSKEEQNQNNFGVQTQPVSSNVYSNCVKSNVKNNNINLAQFTNGLANIQNQSHQQDDVISHIRRQLSNNASTKPNNDNAPIIMSTQQQQQKTNPYNNTNNEPSQRKAYNHPINLLKNDQNVFEGSFMLNKMQNQNKQNPPQSNINNNMGQCMMPQGGGLSFEEALNRKSMMKQKQGLNSNNTTQKQNNIIHDENAIYLQQLQRQQQQQQESGATKMNSTQPYILNQSSADGNTPNKLSNITIDHSNILQQKSIANNNRQLPSPNMYNATQRTQTEQSHNEFMAQQSKKMPSKNITVTQQNGNQNDFSKDNNNNYYRDNLNKPQYQNYTGNSSNTSRNNQLSTSKISNGSNMVDNYNQSSSQLIANSSSSSSSSSQVQYIFSRSQNLSNNLSTGSQKVGSMNGKSTNQEAQQNCYIVNGQKSKNNNSYMSNNHSNTNSIDEQKQFSNINKIALQKNNPAPLTKDSSKSANNLSSINQHQGQSSQTQFKSQNVASQNVTSGISFKQLLNQQNERKLPTSNY